jgi:phage shock protein A
MAMLDQSKVAGFNRFKQRVVHGEAVSQAKSEMASDSLEDRLDALEKEDEIERMLAEVKARRTVKG